MITESQILDTIAKFNRVGRMPTNADIASRGFGLAYKTDPLIEDILVRMSIDGRVEARNELADEANGLKTFMVTSGALVHLAAE